MAFLKAFSPPPPPLHVCHILRVVLIFCFEGEPFITLEESLLQCLIKSENSSSWFGRGVNRELILFMYENLYSICVCTTAGSKTTNWRLTRTSKGRDSRRSMRLFMKVSADKHFREKHQYMCDRKCSSLIEKLLSMQKGPDSFLGVCKLACPKLWSAMVIIDHTYGSVFFFSCK